MLSLRSILRGADSILAATVRRVRDPFDFAQGRLFGLRSLRMTLSRVMVLN